MIHLALLALVFACVVLGTWCVMSGLRVIALKGDLEQERIANAGLMTALANYRTELERLRRRPGRLVPVTPRPQSPN